MFQAQHLLSSLDTYCPQMKVHASLDDLYDKPSLLKPLPVSLSALTDSQPAVPVPGSGPAGVRARFDELYDRELPPAHRRYPVRVELQAAPFAWPAAAEAGGPAFRRDFGRLLRVREDVRVLAASALYNLGRRFGVPVDPRGGIGIGIGVGGGGRGGAGTGDNTTAAAAAAALLLGVHLRTERDALYRDLAFPDYEAQAFYFFNHLEGAAADGRHRVVYLASGLLPGDEDVKRFRARAAGLNATVVTKRDVLGADEVAMLNNHLTWDQRALVDYEVMLRVGFMMGVVESSFSWNLALRRGNVYGGGGAGGVGQEYSGYVGFSEEKPWDFNTSLDPEMMVMWRDRYSILYGRASRAVAMFNGIWP